MVRIVRGGTEILTSEATFKAKYEAEGYARIGEPVKSPRGGELDGVDTGANTAAPQKTQTKSKGK